MKNIQLNKMEIKEKIERIGTKKNNQIFLTNVQLNDILGTKMVSLGKFGIFVSL